MDRKILVIENQFSQFEKICANIKALNADQETEKYISFPEENNYLEFIDWIRVWVNEEYKEGYREYAEKKITNYVREKEIELILMDYILGGAYESKTGIDLAMQLKQDKDLEDIPIIFLSKTEENSIKRLEQVKKFEKKNKLTWVQKGHFGDVILNKTYFKLHVFDKIQEVIPLSKEERFWQSTNSLLKKFPTSEFLKEKLLPIIQSGNYVNLSIDFVDMIIDADKQGLIMIIIEFYEKPS